MALKDRFRRLRHRTSPPNSTSTASGDTTQPPATPTSSSPANVSPGTRSTNASTGQVTPAATQTPVPAASSADLTTLTSTATNPLTNASTIEEVLVARAATNASLAASNGEKKKRRGLFRRKEDPYKDWPEDVYKPHEVPAPKYKRTPDPKHLENLHAFSFGGGGGGGVGAGFGKLVRRSSQQSGVSPGGSNWASPFASRVGSRAPSRLASAAPSADVSRNTSIAEEPEEKTNGGVGSPGKLSQLSPGHRGVGTKSLGRGVAMQPHDVGRVAEEEGEGDVGNVGLMSRPRTARDEDAGENNLDQKKTGSKSSHDMPFTEQELTQALTKATLSNSPPKVVKTPPL